MLLQKASRQQTRIRLGISGPSGSGKTLGALQVAFGLCGDWNKIAVICTEHGSANLYSHLGQYNVVTLSEPYSPERFQNCILLCQASGIEVIIIDSISHAWDGNGGILDIHSKIAGSNTFMNWRKVTPLQNSLMQTILESTCHVITTIRTKQEYVLSSKNDKLIPEKVGLKLIQRDGFEYDLTILFEVNINHFATATKDRTSAFAGKPEFKLTSLVGQQLLDWCNQGHSVNAKEELVQKIKDTSTVEELLALYKASPAYQTILHEYFSQKKKQLETKPSTSVLIHQQNQNNNGKHNANQS